MAKTINEQTKNEQEIELLPQGTPVNNVINLPVDMSKPIDTQWFEKYGGITYPINLQNKFGKRFDTGEMKAIVENTFLTGIVSRKYLYIPHGPIDEMVTSFIDDPLNKLRLLGEPRTTYHGRNKYWLLINDEHQVKIKNSYQDNDYVKFGVAIRNSVGGRLAFGVDLFTFRSICSNGAIFGFRDFGSYSLRHFGSNVAGLSKMLFDNLKEQLGKASEIINWYDRFATKKLGDNKVASTNMLKTLSDHIALKYFPEWIKIVEKDSKKGQERKIIIPYDQVNRTYWELFNSLAAALWHEKDLSFDAVRRCTKTLHEVMISSIVKA